MRSINTDFARPSARQLDAFATIGAATAHEAMGRRGALDSAIKPIQRGTRLLGPAFTAAGGPGDNLTLHAALALARPGDVLVYAVEGFVDGASFGDVMAEAARVKEIAGVVLDGAARDGTVLRRIGLPANAVMALMVGAMMIHGLSPGPQIMRTEPDLLWGIVASMWIGNLMLLVLNLPLVGLWVRLLRIPYRLLYPAIVLLCCIGIYSVANSPTDVAFAALFGVLGYLLPALGFELAPLLLGFILGPMMEENLRRAMTMARGDPTVLVREPISLVLLLAAAILLAITVLPSIRSARDRVFSE